MGKPTGFLDRGREDVDHRPVGQRKGDYFEVDIPHPPEVLLRQAARCMDCGIPFCHGFGCPLENLVPEFNDLVYRGKWRQACEVLHSTNNFPEITGRVCPALCEAACTLNIGDEPVIIRHIELQIAERGFAEGWITPQPARRKTGKRAAVVGSGPSGLAAAQQLTRRGHEVTIFERDEKCGGLLRYGIPDFKLDKSVLDRRLRQLALEGVQFQTGVMVGRDLTGAYLTKRFNAVCLTMGAGLPRDLAVPGRELANVVMAMDFLAQQNRDVSGERGEAASGQADGASNRIASAKDKIVVVIGGGDTGNDCVGTAIRQGAKEVHQYEILPQPPERQNPRTPWPTYPRILRTSTSHEEGGRRRWCILVKRLSGRGGRVEALHGCEVSWAGGAAGWQMSEKPGTEFAQPADMVVLAMGFVHVVHAGLVEELGLQTDKAGNVVVRDGMTSVPGVFAAGDTVSGASLVVRAIRSGRDAAAAIDGYLAR